MKNDKITLRGKSKRENINFIFKSIEPRLYQFLYEIYKYKTIIHIQCEDSERAPGCIIIEKNDRIKGYIYKRKDGYTFDIPGSTKNAVDKGLKASYRFSFNEGIKEIENDLKIILS